MTKECSEYTGHAGSFCTVTSSNLKAIDVGSKVIYAQAAGAAGLDSDVVLYTGPGNSAFGHVTPSFATLSGVVTFSGGTGQFRGFEATVIVTYNPNTNSGTGTGRTASIRRETEAMQANGFTVSASRARAL